MRHQSLTVGLTFILTASSYAADLHVPSQHGSIQSAIQASQHGDVVIVAPGTYREAIDFMGKGITIRSSGGPEQTIIDATDLETSAVQIVNVGVNPARFEGFSVTGGVGRPAPGGTQGGGIYVSNGGPVIDDCHIYGNTASAGGGIAFNFSWGSVTNSRIYNNTANGSGTYGGAGIRSSSSNLYLISSEVFDNVSYSSASGGGAIFKSGQVDVINTVFANNTGFMAGAFRSNATRLTVINSTFTGNHSRQGAGVITCDVQPSKEPEFYNSIFWGNTSDFEGETLNMVGVSDAVVSHSLVEGGWDGEGVGNLDADPKFKSANDGDVELLSDSPAIDAGSNALLPDDITTDVIGNERIINDTVDMGAAEASVGAPVLGACCLSDGLCVEVSESDCALAGGTFQGGDSTCSSSSCPQPIYDADFNGDGWVDMSDLLDLLRAWGSDDPFYDLNASGSVDMNDMNIVLMNWGIQG